MSPFLGGCLMMISLTEPAANHVHTLMSQNNMDGFALRIAVSSGGCSGYSYILDMVDEQDEDDLVFTDKGISIYCDPKSFRLLEGLEIGYQSSLMGGNFTFTNPNAKRSCGCGTSFTVTDAPGC